MQYVVGADITAFPVTVVVELATESILIPTETGCANIAISAMAGARLTLNVPVANKNARNQATQRHNLMRHDASTNQERRTDE